MIITKHIQSSYALFLLAVLALVLYNSMLPGITYYAVIFCILVFLAKDARVKFDKNALLIFSFALLYGLIPLIMGYTDSYKNVICSIAPPVFYIFGRYVVSKVDSAKNLCYVIVGILLFFALNTYILCVWDILSTGQLVNVTRSLSRFIGQEESEVMAATGFGVNISLGLIGLSLFLCANKKYLYHYLLLILFLLSLLVTVHLVNRTGIILSFILTFFVLFFSLRSQNKIVIIISTIVVALAVYFITSESAAISEIVDAYQMRESTESNSGLLDTGSRSWRWVDGLSKLLTNPLGYANQFHEEYYVHNMWLDVSRLSGTIPFLLVLLITIEAAKCSWFTMRKWRTELSYIMGALCLCCLLVFFMEPVIEGCAIYFYLFCMFWGISLEYKNRLQTRRIKEYGVSSSYSHIQ